MRTKTCSVKKLCNCFIRNWCCCWLCGHLNQKLTNDNNTCEVLNSHYCFTVTIVPAATWQPVIALDSTHNFYQYAREVQGLTFHGKKFNRFAVTIAELRWLFWTTLGKLLAVMSVTLFLCMCSHNFCWGYWGIVNDSLWLAVVFLLWPNISLTPQTLDCGNRVESTWLQHFQ